MVGTPAIMREQLDKLAGLAREPGVVIQILPFTAGDHPGTDGPILVYDFDGASSVAYTECNGGGRIVESADEVTARPPCPSPSSARPGAPPSGRAARSRGGAI